MLLCSGQYYRAIASEMPRLGLLGMSHCKQWTMRPLLLHNGRSLARSRPYVASYLLLTSVVPADLTSTTSGAVINLFCFLPRPPPPPTHPPARYREPPREIEEAIGARPRGEGEAPTLRARARERERGLKIKSRPMGRRETDDEEPEGTGSKWRPR